MATGPSRKRNEVDSWLVSEVESEPRDLGNDRGYRVVTDRERRFNHRVRRGHRDEHIDLAEMGRSVLRPYMIKPSTIVHAEAATARSR
jgi:hypothetical protein